MNSIDAVVVVDMDEFHLPFATDPELLLETHKDMLSSCRKPVVVVTTAGFDAHSDIISAVSSCTVNYNNKMNRDAFSHPRLASLLHFYRAKNILVTGVYLGQCIDATISGAYGNGFKAFTTRDLAQEQLHFESESYVTHNPLYELPLHEIKRKIK